MSSDSSTNGNRKILFWLLGTSVTVTLASWSVVWSLQSANDSINNERVLSVEGCCNSVQKDNVAQDKDIEYIKQSIDQIHAKLDRIIDAKISFKLPVYNTSSILSPI